MDGEQFFRFPAQSNMCIQDQYFRHRFRPDGTGFQQEQFFHLGQ
jgi:hypothetical protein